MNTRMVFLNAILYSVVSSAQPSSAPGASTPTHGETLDKIAKERAMAEIAQKKGRDAVDLIRKNLCPECPEFIGKSKFYRFSGGRPDEVTSIRLQIEKNSPFKIADTLFEVPVTIELKNGLPETISVHDLLDISPTRQSPIGLISADRIPIAPDGKIAKLTYPENELKAFFKDKSAYSISEFFWDNTENTIRPAAFRAEKPFSFCGFKFEKGETLNFTYDKTWEMVPVHSFTHRSKKYDGNNSYRMTFSRQYACRAKAYKYKTGELILFNNDDPTN